MYKYIHCSIIYDSKNRKQPDYLIFRRLIRLGLWYVHTVEYYAAIKKDMVKLTYLTFY